VLATLERLDLEKDTLVVFTSDNGPWASKGKAGGVAGPLRGSKGCTLEGGVREPTIVRWPGKIAPGTSSDAIAGTTDILPTFVALAGGKLRDDVKIDGVDLSPLLLGKTQDSPREAWYYFQGNKLQAVRSGPWKLAVTAQGFGMGMKEKHPDLGKPMRLYNLDQEIGEVTDVAAKNPQVVARLGELAEAMAADIEADARPAGVVENPVTLYPTEPRGRRAPKKVVANAKPIDWKRLMVGDSFPSASAPKIAGQPFEIICSIEGENPSGVILAHGGSSTGYALYANFDGELVFAVRHRSGEIHRVSQAIEGTGRLAINASLAKDGSLKLVLDDGEAKVAKSPGLLRNHPQEDLCVGHDNKNPIDESAPGGEFSGQIISLGVSVGGVTAE
jgi:hypothetical protein